MSAAAGDILLVERKGPVLSLALNRPNKYNAISVELSEALLDACRSVPAEVAVVVVRGEGKHFCCGSDLKDLYQADRAKAEQVLRVQMEACQALAKLPQLTVAVAHGKCYGGGAFLPLYCDLRLGRAGVEFAMPEVSLGWIPPYGLERLHAAVPRPFALDMLLSGRVCGDREALERGMIQRLLAQPGEEDALIEKLARIPRRVFDDTLALARPKNPREMETADGKAFADFLNHFDTDHARNQIASFVEKKRS